jgi:hypothetical protein
LKDPGFQIPWSQERWLPHIKKAESMSPSGAKRSEKGLLTPDNCVVAIIDLQPQMLVGVANVDRQSIINRQPNLPFFMRQ